MGQQTARRDQGRVRWIDLAKGLVIFLVIVGHTVNRDTNGNLVRAAIFSFHMPFYFILSSLTFRYSRDMAAFRRNTIRAAKHLLIPVAFVVVACTVWMILRDRSLLTSVDFWQKRLYTVVIGSGINQKYADIEVPLIGIPWFFYALFLGRTAFDYLQLQFERQKLIVACAVISAVGVLFKSYGYLPFSLDIAMACMPFFYAGMMLKDCDFSRKPLLKALGWALAWALTLWLTYPKLEKWTYLELAVRRYPLYPISFLTAVAGTMVACHAAALADRLGAVVSPLVYVGRHSMILLIVHCLDDFWDFFWANPDRQFVAAGRRIACDLIVFAAAMIAVTAWRAVRRSSEGKR